MTHSFFSTRRHFMSGVLGSVALGSLPKAAQARTEFLHQPGIITPQQPYAYFIALDLQTAHKSDVIALMKQWTDAANALMAGQARPGFPFPQETESLKEANLTITFGFGVGLFLHEGTDRYGLLARRPAPLADLPRFNGDQLVPAHSGGDLCIQSCADDSESAFYAARALVKLAYGIAEPRWSQAGFIPHPPKHGTARNLMGFKNGTINPNIHSPHETQNTIWADPTQCSWMQGGSYLVARLIRIALEHWDRMNVPFQEQTMGRQKISGAPIGAKHENDPLTLKKADKDGNPITAETSHARLAAPEENGGAQILRRAYSYNNGLSFIAERWPPWRQANEFDVGLLFLCYQKDPRTGFTKIFDRMSKLDMMNQFTTHIGSGLFACPGIKQGHYIGESLLEG